jgi:hypothetical protein
MSTRACYTFKDERSEIHVFKHHDGYPAGAAVFINRALKSSWELPRYEADEFAAAFVGANKDGPGGIRLMPSGKIEEVASMDTEWHYLVEPINGREDLRVTVFRGAGGKKVWAGPLSKMAAWAAKEKAA